MTTSAIEVEAASDTEIALLRQQAIVQLLRESSLQPQVVAEYVKEFIQHQVLTHEVVHEVRDLLLEKGVAMPGTQPPQTLGEEDLGQNLARGYAIVMGKVVAGILRCVFEDILSGMCQMVWLCKLWHSASIGAKIFTTCSVSTGVVLSFAGPLWEFFKARNLKWKAREAGTSDAELGINLENWLASAEQATTTDADADARSRLSILEVVVPNTTIQAIINGQPGANKATLHWKLLLGAAGIFWSTMSILPFALDIECGQGFPAKGHMVFFGLAMVLGFIEVWVTVQTSRGYRMFTSLSPPLMLGFLFGFLGRFDTYSDVVFARMIATCEPITWFSIYEHVWYLPLPLDQLVVSILAIGVYMCQAIPGLWLLAKQPSLLPLALKLNEYNVLLTVMELQEANPKLEDLGDSGSGASGATSTKRQEGDEASVPFFRL
mmetsp:Transcript_64761/g.162983  ORF Transcript_64761/g.162983 Transcript_64761/m.162983 type:complete len:434 (+) Transcript_64761:85-1386(+)|eukprot:CAMPEP_0115185598 /NCGR_PEP_ID=MMETSP0270-20121206/9553_1 /TAXON_ID=71861 /ORGANISM="Scrippsiella trochoidea, Strain CCMP3099" /LENGTH=433 /DNA_ID=CAMNT_0002598705 /DNA_START=21 /DNA_END=1322 /DNA_ORIENTATION=-